MCTDPSMCRMQPRALIYILSCSAGRTHPVLSRCLGSLGKIHPRDLFTFWIISVCLGPLQGWLSSMHPRQRPERSCWLAAPRFLKHRSIHWQDWLKTRPIRMRHLDPWTSGSETWQQRPHNQQGTYNMTWRFSACHLVLEIIRRRKILVETGPMAGLGPNSTVHFKSMSQPFSFSYSEAAAAGWSRAAWPGHCMVAPAAHGGSRSGGTGDHQGYARMWVWTWKCWVKYG